jgi:hypothetical protein
MPPEGVVAVPSAPRVDQNVRTEHAFLALCIALPTEGGDVLAEIDPDALLTSGVLRRAAHHLRGRTASPLSDLPPDDDELARTIAELVERAGGRTDVGADHLQHCRLVLEIGRVDRAIRRARAEGGQNVALARERAALQGELHDVGSRLDGTV